MDGDGSVGCMTVDGLDMDVQRLIDDCDCELGATVIAASNCSTILGLSLIHI